MEQFLDPQYLLGVWRRRWFLILAPIALGVPLALLIAYVLPPVYEASARILVEGQQIPNSLARSTVSADAQERIQLIRQRLTTRDNLLDLARRHEVFPGRDDLSRSEVVKRMRDATEIQAVVFQQANRRDSIVTSVDIAFRAHRAQTAAAVANALLTQLLEQNIRQRNALAAETLNFFDSEVERLGGALTALEARISDFKKENELALPDSLDFRRRELSDLQRERFTRESRRLALDERRRWLEQALELGRPDGGLTAEEREIERLRTTLAQQSAIYSPTHPSIRSLTARIAALEAAQENAVLSDAQEPETPGPQTLREAEALREIERIGVEIELLDEQQEADEARIAQLRESIERTPQVAIELGALMRERESLQEQYQEAVLKQAEAEIGERLEVNRQAERLEVIEQPQTPEEPISPNRILIAGAGGVLSVGLGLGLALLAELLNPALRTAKDFERRLELRPVVMIPYIRTEHEGRRRKWRLRIGLLVALVMIPATLFLVDQYVMPLPLLYERFMDRSGLGEIVRLVRMRFGG